LCEANRKDIEDIQPIYLKDLSFFYVTNMLQVLDIALLDEQVPDAISLEIPKENTKA
jgi:ATP-dependent Lon protease